MDTDQYLSQYKINSKNGQRSYTQIMRTLVNCWNQRPSTILAWLFNVPAFLVTVKQWRGPKMWPHHVHQSQIAMPTRSILNAYNEYLLHIQGPQWWSHIILMIFSDALAILLLKKTIKMKWNIAIIIICLRVIFVFRKFPIGLKENLREEDN